MPGVIEETIENGRLITKYSDGSKSTRCIGEECIQDHISDSESDTMSHGDCNCGRCTSKRLMKSDEDTLDTESVEVLDRELPDEIFEQVMEYFQVEQVEQNPNEDPELDEVPEDAEEVGKTLAKSLYDDSRPEPSGGVPSAQHLGNVVDEKSDSGGTPGSPEVYARSLMEKDSVDLEKSADTPDSLDRFYEKVES